MNNEYESSSDLEDFNQDDYTLQENIDIFKNRDIFWQNENIYGILQSLKNPVLVLFYFQMFHDSLVENINLANKDILKNYFHLRHDVFGSIIYYKMYGVINLKTDINLRDYGVDSNKTPDLIYKTDENIFIVDFVVSTKIEFADQYKGYGYKDIKYTEEANALNADVVILPLTLKDENINILWKNLEKLGLLSSDVKNYVTDLKNICVNNLSIINESFSTFFQTEFNFAGKDNYKLNYIKKKGKKLMIINNFDYYNVYKKREIIESIIYTRKKNFDLLYREDGTIKAGKGVFSKELVINSIEKSFDNIFKFIFKYVNGKKLTLENKEGIMIYVDEKNADYIDVGIPDWYEEKLIEKCDKISSNSVKFDRFTDNKMSEDIVNLSCKEYADNTYNMNLKMNHLVKKSFSVPFPDVNNLETISYKEINQTLELFHNKTSDPIVNRIIAVYLEQGGVKKYMLKEDMNDHFRKLQNNMNDSVSEYYKRMYNCIKTNNLDKKTLKHKDFAQLEPEAKDLLNKMNLNKKLYDEYKMKYSKIVQTSAAKLQIGSSKSTSSDRNILNYSYSHFKDRSSYDGWGNREVNNEDYNNCFRRVFDDLYQPSNLPLIDVDLKQYDDFEGLNKMKKDFVSSFLYKDVILRSKLSSLLRLIQNWANTLMVMSSKNEKGNIFHVDNLGYKNFLLIIRSGKSSLRTNTTWDFKMCYPVNDDIVELDYGDRSNSHSNFFYVNNIEYVCTPWTKIHIDLCKYYQTLGISSILHNTIMLQRYHNYKLKTQKEMLCDTAFAYLLAFSGKRSIETVLHNMRYLLFNLLSDYADYKKLLPDFCYHNSTKFHKYISNCIAENLPRLYKQVNNLRYFSKDGLDGRVRRSNIYSLFDNKHKITNKNEFADFFYVSYNMRKGYYNQSLEQKGNLVSVLEDLLSYKNKNKKQSDYASDILKDEPEKMFESDFNYDPMYCKYLGKITSDYLLSLSSKNQIDNMLNQVLNKQIDEMANNKGLRGWVKENFFNKKGYEIIYQFIEDIWIKDYPEDNLTIGNFVERFPLIQAKLHQVEKEQRGGSREIYVLDIYTKAHQQIIEQYMKKICKLLPNEVISIPSNRRINYIHSRFHEKEVSRYDYVLNCSLDCRRWGPHSNTQKYIEFFKGMQGCLPDDFIKYCMRFFEIYEHKRVLTRKYVVDTMTNNERYKDILQLLKKDDLTIDGEYFELEYSFMMGIFNYLSSILHAANQLSISNIISKACVKYYKQPVSVICIAHSDDSQARFFSKDKKILEYCFNIYEFLLKSANHILSSKKCNVNYLDINKQEGSNYLEFLSILYLGNEVVPMLSKFINSLEYYPTDKGYASDIGQCISKSIEVITYGGTLAESYLMMKFMSHFVREFYNVNNTDAFDHLPYWFLGPIDAHPISILLTGGDADVLRIIYSNIDSINKILVLINELGMDLEDTSGGLGLNWNINVRPSASIKKLRSETEPNWVHSNVKSKDAKQNIQWFKNQLFKSSFYLSLTGDSDINKLRRAITIRSTPSINTRKGLITLDQFKEAILLVEANNNLKLPEHNILKLMSLIHEKQIEQLKNISDGYIENINPEAVNYSYKPTFLQLREDGLKTNLKINAGQMIVYRRYPEYIDYLGLNANYSRHTLFLEQLIISNNYNVENLNDDQYMYILNRLLSKSMKQLYCYSSVPSKFRDIRDSNDLVDWMNYNSIFGYKLNFKRVNYEPIKKYIKLDRKDEDFVRFSITYMYLNSINEHLGDKVKYKYDNQICDSKYIIKDNQNKLYFDHHITSKTLEDINTVLIWTKPQQKFKGKYIGTGEAILKSEEAFIKIIFENDNAKFIVDFEDEALTTTFSKDTTDFIKSSIYDMIYKNDFTGLPSMYLDGTLVIGEKSSGNIGIGYPNEMLLVYGKIEFDFLNKDEFKDQKIIIDKDRKFKLEGNQLILNFPYEGIYNKGVVLSKSIVPETIPDTDIYVLDLISATEGTVMKMDRNVVLDNFHQTAFYSCIFNNNFFNNYYNDNPVVESILENSKFDEFIRDSVISKEELNDVIRDQGIMPALIPKELLSIYEDKHITFKERKVITNLLGNALDSDDPLKDINDLKDKFSESEIKLGLKVFKEKEDWWFGDLPPVLDDKVTYYLPLMDEILILIHKILIYIRNNGNVKDKYLSEFANDFLQILSIKTFARITMFNENEISMCNVLKDLIDRYDFNNEEKLESMFDDDFKWVPRVNLNASYPFSINAFRLLQVCTYRNVFFEDAVKNNDVPFPSYFRISGLKRKRLDLIPKLNKFYIAIKNKNFNIYTHKVQRLLIPYDMLNGFYSYDFDHDNYEDIKDSAIYNDDIEDEWITNVQEFELPEEPISKNNKINLGIELGRNYTNNLSTLTYLGRNFIYITDKKYKPNKNIPLKKWIGNLENLNGKLKVLNHFNIYTSSTNTMDFFMKNLKFKLDNNDTPIENIYENYMGMKGSDFEGINAFMKMNEVKEALNKAEELRKKLKHKKDSEVETTESDPYKDKILKMRDNILEELGYKEKEIMPTLSFNDLINEAININMEEKSEKKSLRLFEQSKKAIIKHDKQVLIKNTDIIAEVDAISSGLSNRLFGSRLYLTEQSKNHLLLVLKLFNSTNKIITEANIPHKSFLDTFKVIIENCVTDNLADEQDFWNISNCIDYCINKFKVIENADENLIQPQRIKLTKYLLK